MKGFRQIGNILEGHPTPKIPFTDVGTGSLGQGICVAAGMAYGHKHLLKSNVRIWTVLGDGEMMEGSVWEAMSFASLYKLNNLIAILDLNKMGQSDWASLSSKEDWNEEVYRKRAEAFGWHAIIVDGHNVYEINKVLGEARKVADKPIFVIAKTAKGAGTKVADELGWHGKPLTKELQEDTLKGLDSKIDHSITNVLKTFNPEKIRIFSKDLKMDLPESFVKKVSTRRALGDALVHVLDTDEPDNFKYVVLDGDVGNSTFTELSKKKYPSRFIQCYIAEQNMVSVAQGLAVLGFEPIFSSFSAFLTRA